MKIAPMRFHSAPVNGARVTACFSAFDLHSLAAMCYIRSRCNKYTIKPRVKPTPAAPQPQCQLMRGSKPRLSRRTRACFFKRRDHIEHEYRAHVVIAEVLPQFRKEERSETARMAAKAGGVGQFLSPLKLITTIENLTSMTQFSKSMSFGV